MASVGTVVIEVDANIAKLVDGMKKSSAQISNLQKTANSAIKSINSSFSMIKGSIAGLSLSYLVKEAVGMADSYKLMEGQIKNVTNSKLELAAAEQAVFDISQKTRVDVQATTKLYTSLAGALGDMGKSQKETLATTELVNKAIAISGSSAQESAASVLQLGQAFGSGKLAGDELKSLMENSKGLTRAIAEGMNVPIGALKELGAQGAITSEVLYNALKKSGDSINEKFKNIPVTVGQSITQVTNSIGQMLSDLDESVGATDFLSSIGTGISEWITENRFKMIEFGRDVGRVFQLMGTAIIGSFSLLKAGFYEVIANFGEGYNYLADGWDTIIVSMQNAFKGFADAIGKGFYDVINFVLKKISDMVNTVSNAMGGAFEFIGVENPFGEISLSVGEYTSGIETATKKTGELLNMDWAKNASKSAIDDTNNALKTGATLWDEIASNTTKATVAVDASTEAGKKAAAQAEKSSKGAKKAGKDAAKAAKAAAKALEDAAKKADDLNRKFLELTGQKGEIFQLDVDKQLKEFMESGIYTAEQIGQAYDGMYKEYVESGKDANKDIALDFTDQFKGLFEGLFSGDLGGAIKGFMEGVSMDLMKGMIDNMSKSITSGANGLMEGLGAMGGGMVGVGLGLLSSLLTTTVTQAEIDASIGRVEFDDDSLKNLEGVFADAQYPMLEVTNKMYGHLRNMDANFFSIARAMSAEASAGGIDLTGANYVDTESSTFLGFSSKSMSLIGTGLNFQLQNLNDMMDESALHVGAYTTTLSTSTSLFGLRSKQKILESMSNLPPEVASDMAEGFANGFEMIMTAGVSLGLDEANLSEALRSTRIAIGKIDFTGLSDDEVANRLSQAYSTYFSDVITGVDDFSILIGRYGKNTEEALETLGRIAVEYDQGQHSLGLIGKTFTNGTVKTLKVWTATTDELVGTTQLWGHTVGGTMTAVTKEFSGVVTEVYTAQMQILDIIESTGGLTNFQDAMGAFVSNFYTEAEQLAMQTKSMNQAFVTLPLEEMGYVIPKTDAEFRQLLETMDTSTEAGAKLYGETLLLSEGFAQMTDSAESLAAAVQAVTDASNENIKTYLDSFKDSQQLASDMASGLGVSLATTDAGLTALFEKLKGGVDGLTDSELQFLMANKGVIEEAANKAKLAAEDAAKTAADLTEATAKSVTDMIKSISDAWLGNLSYLTMKQKTEYASGYLAIASSSNGAIDTVEAARLAAEAALKSTSTQEEFIPIFDRYIQELEKQAPKATTDDVVAQLKIVAEKLDKLEATTRQTA